MNDLRGWDICCNGDATEADRIGAVGALFEAKTGPDGPMRLAIAAWSMRRGGAWSGNIELPRAACDVLFVLGQRQWPPP